jgi:hypothetical protein
MSTKRFRFVLSLALLQNNKPEVAVPVSFYDETAGLAKSEREREIKRGLKVMWTASSLFFLYFFLVSEEAAELSRR